MERNHRYGSTKLATLLLMGGALWIASSAYASEEKKSQEPHLTIHISSSIPSDQSFMPLSSPAPLANKVRPNKVVPLSQYAGVSAERSTISSPQLTTSPSGIQMTINMESPLPPQGVQVRRDALVQTMTQDDVELLKAYGAALSKTIYRPYNVSDSVFKNMMDVTTVKDLFLTPKGWLKLGLRAGLCYLSYDISDTTIGLFNFTLFKQIFGKENYYPYQAINNGNASDLAQTGFLYLFMLATATPSLGAQTYEGYQRLSHFLQGMKKSRRQRVLYNPKNSTLATVASVVLGAGAGIATLPKLYSLVQRFQQTGVYGGFLLNTSLSFYYLSNFYTLLDSSTSYVHSKIDRHLNGDDPDTARCRSILLDLSQNSITKWLELSPDQRKNKAQEFSFATDQMSEAKLYEMLFVMFDSAKAAESVVLPLQESREEPVRVQKQPLVRRGLRWFSEGVAALVGPLAFEVISTSAKSQLTSLGCDDRTSSGLAYTAASIGSVFTTMLSRSVVKNSLHQLYDSWTGYKNQEDMASSLYNNTSSGYTSYPKARKVLTTYNQLNGTLLGLTMGKSVYDALPTFPAGIRYPAAGVAMIASGALQTLFLQRWTHKLVNVVDKNILQKLERLKSLSDPSGVMSDEVVEFIRDARLWITRMPAPVVQQLHKLAFNSDLRKGFLERLQQNLAAS
ncbi:hypothetical protein [Candidatus Finniella inopinata]|uniref:Transmembrane protein n=1 Tax=Candidatus Finniella inopinata TaxID=1696036 RepID=A0A4Q7DIY3_9PROT|nr:hypothetical protein [Candidatus Finniella inopinata]RZI46085.1 hypothetical protein EQU50_03905 [Candidatus Finniella inopinata]